MMSPASILLTEGTRARYAQDTDADPGATDLRALAAGARGRPRQGCLGSCQYVSTHGKPTVRSLDTSMKNAASTVEEQPALDVKSAKELSKTCGSAEP